MSASIPRRIRHQPAYRLECEILRDLLRNRALHFRSTGSVKTISVVGVNLSGLGVHLCGYHLPPPMAERWFSPHLIFHVLISLLFHRVPSDLDSVFKPDGSLICDSTHLVAVSPPANGAVIGLKISLDNGIVPFSIEVNSLSSPKTNELACIGIH